MVLLLTASAVPTGPSVNVEPAHVIDVPSKLAEYAYPSLSQPPSGTAEPSATMPTTLSTVAAAEKLIIDNTAAINEALRMLMRSIPLLQKTFRARSPRAHPCAN